ncbi:MAG: RNA-binding transcriptional accessory protein [Kiritimatiellae bacterium]|nr:RNA-binding transcriptional accessory protein [Kiritimatiellia bacterium]
MNQTIIEKAGADAGVSPRQAAAVQKLLADGATVPFIARYRKEAHGNLDEVAIGKIQERLAYYSEIEDRRQTILKSIEEQGKLTPELEGRIRECWQKSALEDLYQPYKPKRRTRAQIAKEKGFEPLADGIWSGDAPAAAAAAEEDLQYARDIIAERIADNAAVRGCVRRLFATKSTVKSEVAQPKPSEPTKFEQYYDYSEPIATIPSHRYLAVRRGQKEGVLWVKLDLDRSMAMEEIMEIVRAEAPDCKNAVCAAQVEKAAEDAYRRLLAPSCEMDVAIDKKMEADRAAVEIFADNLRHLLLAAPLGEKAVLAIDPGIRTGCKVAMMDATGKYIGKTVVFPQQKPEESARAIAAIVNKYRPEAIAVGNGTAGRETEAFVRQTLKRLKDRHPEIPTPAVVSVSEAGASVYSASEIARKEFPDLDLTVRGAISIGRRLQDPLAELVKIDPKAIGVGQYQHDVHQPLLGAKLDEVVVSCVNGVGVELNTASAPLLERVSGVGASLARAIVAWRDENGRFTSREDLKKVKGLGAKAFEQCAGFLRIRGAANPLDASAVHPERYALVEKMACDLGVSLRDLVGNASAARKIDVRKYIGNDVGEPTLRDIVEELAKPGRDPRAVFEPPKFRDDVTKIEDVREGMKLEGIVTNVTAFGAFVDIGVHQDGLVHLSELSDAYVSDPGAVVKTGDRLKVTVIGIDRARGRISLSAKTRPSAAAGGAHFAAAAGGQGGAKRGPRTSFAPPSSSGFSCNPFANL